MKRSIVFVMCVTFLVVGCGEEPKPSSTLPPIGDRFDKGKELIKEKELKTKVKDKDKKPTAPIGWLPLLLNDEPVVWSPCPYGHAIPIRRTT